MRILAISCSLYGIIICLKAIKKLSWGVIQCVILVEFILEKRKLINGGKYYEFI